MEEIISNFNVITKSTEILNYTECSWAIYAAAALWGICFTLLVLGITHLFLFVKDKSQKQSVEDEKHFYIYFIVVAVLVIISLFFSSYYFKTEEQNNASTCKCVYTIHITNNENETLSILNDKISDFKKVYGSYYTLTLYTDANATEVEIFDIKLNE